MSLSIKDRKTKSTDWRKHSKYYVINEYEQEWEEHEQRLRRRLGELKPYIMKCCEDHNVNGMVEILEEILGDNDEQRGKERT